MTDYQIQLVEELLEDGRPCSTEVFHFGPMTYDAIEAMVRKVKQLRELVEKIDFALRVPSAECVPAIGDVFKMIDEASE